MRGGFGGDDELDDDEEIKGESRDDCDRRSVSVDAREIVMRSLCADDDNELLDF